MIKEILPSEFKVLKLEVVDEILGLENIATHAIIEAKEFDDSDVDYNVEDAPEKPFVTEIRLNLPLDKDAVVPIEEVDESVVISWIQSHPYLKAQMDAIFKKNRLNYYLEIFRQELLVGKSKGSVVTIKSF
jgi:hypothetical protein